MITVYFDENMPPHLARAFNEILKKEELKNGHPKIEIIHFNEAGFKGLDDSTWINELKNTNSFVITKDIHISKRKDEMNAYSDAGLGLFFLRGKSRKENINVWQTLHILSKHWESMLNIMQIEKRPFMYVVSFNKRPKPLK